MCSFECAAVAPALYPPPPQRPLIIKRSPLYRPHGHDAVPAEPTSSHRGDKLKRHTENRQKPQARAESSKHTPFRVRAFEHDLIVQRTQEGKAIARQNANFKDGRPKKFSRVQLDHALKLLETHSYKQVERLTGISITTIYRAKLERAKREHLREAPCKRA
ncbi:MAG: hypothetical protein IJ697_07650 [Synergistaceae bacterium]|nr:hypothetical protein [Synergistaceae bacterium]